MDRQLRVMVLVDPQAHPELYELLRGVPQRYRAERLRMLAVREGKLEGTTPHAITPDQEPTGGASRLRKKMNLSGFGNGTD